MNYAIIKAKRNIFAALGEKNDETVKTSRWLLERKRPEEYGSNLNLTGEINHVDRLSPEKQAALEALIKLRQ